MAKKEIQLEAPIKFYGGTETLQFDRANWTWYWHTPHGLVPLSGITGVVKIIDKSLYLTPWAAKMVYLKLMRTMPTMLDDSGRVVTKSMPVLEFDKLVQEAKGAHKEKLDDASDVGALAHDWIWRTVTKAIAENDGIVETMDELSPVDPRAFNAGMAAFSWMTRHNVRWLSTERPVFSKKWRYAGTADGTALVDSCDNHTCCTRVFQDEKSLIDWKSSNQLNVEYLYQTAAYVNALLEEFPDLGLSSRWILRLGKDDGKFQAWYERDSTQDFDTYLAALNLKRRHGQVERRMAEQSKLKTFVKRAEKKKTKEEEKAYKVKMKLEKREAKLATKASV